MIESIHRAKFGSANVSKPVVNINRNGASTPPVAVNVNKTDRKAYMREYMKAHRKKPKLCPHCGKEV